jgi:tryptophanyl-tRNA synthetase
MSDRSGNYQRRVVSGVRPGGRLHLGNYFGSIHDCLAFQYEYVGGAFYFIADLHEMTGVPPGDVLREQTLSAAIDYLALGLQPDMVTFYLQSDVPQVSELMWMFACVIPWEWLCPVSPPDEVGQATQTHGSGRDTSAGLLMYPALMAADCLALRATDVPIGADQCANMDLVRQIASRWNRLFRSSLFPVPEAKLSTASALPGLNGQRMSKSADNIVPIFAEVDELTDRVGSIGADGIVLELLKVVTGGGPAFLDAADGYAGRPADLIHAKSALVAAVDALFCEARHARRGWARRRHEVEDLLMEGGDRARMEATETLELVRDLVGVGLGAR